MTKARRTFSSEFKLEAASLVLDHGYSISEASRAVDVGDSHSGCIGDVYYQPAGCQSE